MLRVAVCISGNGSLVPPLLNAAADIPVELSCVVADRPEAPGLKSAWTNRVETVCIDRRRFASSTSEGVQGNAVKPSDQLSDAVLTAVRSRADIVILAGFLSILKGSIIDEYKGRILNIHPALLPK